MRKIIERPHLHVITKFNLSKGENTDQNCARSLFEFPMHQKNSKLHINYDNSMSQSVLLTMLTQQFDTDTIVNS